MNLKDIQKKLKSLRDRIHEDGHISSTSEEELRDILASAVVSANDELSSIQKHLHSTMAMRAGNDNILSDDQKKRLRIIEKTGTGSCAVH